jgi:hypothetical protein
MSPEQPPVRSLLSPGEGRLQRALLLSKRYKQPVPGENHPPEELSARILDPRDTAVSVEPEGLEVDLDPYAPPGLLLRTTILSGPLTIRLALICV